MTIDLEPVSMPRAPGLGEETEEQRRLREAREALEELQAMPQAFVPPTGLSGQSAVMDDPPPPAPDLSPQSAGRMRNELARDRRTVLATPQARAVGDAYRAAPPTNVQPRVVRGPDGSEQQIFPPGVLPPPMRESDASIAERFGPPDTAPPPAQPAPTNVAPPAATPPPSGPAGGAALPPQAPPPAPSMGRALGSPREQAVALAQERLATKAPMQGGPKPAGNAPPDYTGADVSDAIRNPLHRLANALRAYAGRPTTEFRSEGQAARARDAATAAGKQEGADARDERTAERSREDRELAIRERQQASLEQDRSADNQRMARQSEALDRYRTRQTEIQAAVADGRISADQARAAMTTAQRELFEARNDPGSDVSERRRAAFGQELAVREDATGRPLDVDVSGQSAADVDAVSGTLRGTRAVARPSEAARRAAGQARTETTEALESSARAVGMTAEQIARYGSDARGRAALTREIEDREQEGRRAQARSGAADGGGPEILPGIRAASYAGVPEARAFRTRYTQASEAMRALDALEAVAQRHGLDAVIDPRVEAEIAPAMLRLRGMAAQTQGSGVINPSEVPVINAAIPDPTSLRGRTLGNLNGNLRAWRTSVTDGVTGHAVALGVDDDGLGRITSGLRRRGAFARPAPATPRQPPPAPRAGMVRMVSPAGVAGWMAADRVEAARAAGYTPEGGADAAR